MTTDFVELIGATRSSYAESKAKPRGDCGRARPSNRPSKLARERRTAFNVEDRLEIAALEKETLALSRAQRELRNQLRRNNAIAAAFDALFPYGRS